MDGRDEKYKGNEAARRGEVENRRKERSKSRQESKIGQKRGRLHRNNEINKNRRERDIRCEKKR